MTANERLKLLRKMQAQKKKLKRLLDNAGIVPGAILVGTDPKKLAAAKALQELYPLL